MVLGMGTDLVDVPELRRRLERTPEIRDQVYDPSELAWCEARRPPWPWLAACFAAKEAVMKALGTGWTAGVTFRDIVVQPPPDAPAAGDPAVVLQGEAGARLAEPRARILLSLSHDGDYAVALALRVAAD